MLIGLSTRETVMAAESLHLAHQGPGDPDPISLLKAHGIEAVAVYNERNLGSLEGASPPQLALIDSSSVSGAELRRRLRACARLKVPAIVLVPELQLPDLDLSLVADDFVISPPRPDELLARADLVLKRTRSPARPSEEDDAVRIGDLVIDPARYEVSLRGRRVDLRFKEYELLRLLATSAGRVFTREALLNRIWGYEYFGGTRTVDVHIRRLRSKLDDTEHTFIETIWNVGYRFRAAPPDRR